jgi:hypothetical protein
MQLKAARPAGKSGAWVHACTLLRHCCAGFLCLICSARVSGLVVASKGLLVATPVGILQPLGISCGRLPAVAVLRGQQQHTALSGCGWCVRLPYAHTYVPRSALAGYGAFMCLCVRVCDGLVCWLMQTWFVHGMCADGGLDQLEPPPSPQDACSSMATHVCMRRFQLLQHANPPHTRM